MEDKKVRSDGCVTAQQADVDSHHTGKMTVTLLSHTWTFPCACVCVCVRHWRGGVRILVWPLSWIDSRPIRADRWQTWAWLSTREFLPHPATDRQRTHHSAPPPCSTNTCLRVILLSDQLWKHLFITLYSLTLESVAMFKKMWFVFYFVIC